MEISKAVKIGLETNSLIYRKEMNCSERKAYIKPTNSYEACILLVMHKEKTQDSSRCWNPTADDLMADDWEVTKG